MTARTDCCGSRFGTSFEARCWRSLDACGLVCVTFSLSVHVYAAIVNGLFVLSTPVSTYVYALLYLPLTFMAVWSLYKAWSTNPGAVPMGARPLVSVKKAGAAAKPQRATRRCHKCNDNYKPARAHHDSVTGRCIVKFDHYCPWVGNAVGALNHKFFILFIGYTMVTCITSLILISMSIVHCGMAEENDPSSSPQEDWQSPDSEKADPERLRTLFGILFVPTGVCEGLYSNYFVIVLFVVAISFLVFTACMFVEQMEAVESNTSKIARLKIRNGSAGTEYERVSHDFNEMFGGNSPNLAWHWFVPISVKYPASMSKVVLGYEWDPTFGDAVYQEDDLVAAIKGENKVGDEEAQLPTEGLGAPSSKPKGNLKKAPEPLHTVGTKKRSGKKKKAEDNPTFVVPNQDRLE